MAFIGMRLPATAATSLSGVKVPGDCTPLHEMHVTLAFLGNQVPIASVLKSVACCYMVAQEFAPFDLAAAMLMSFPADPEGRIPVIARIVTPKIFELRARLVQLLETNQVEYSKRHPQYKPHVTLSYAQEAVKPQVIQPIRWPTAWITVWGGDESDELLSAEIQLRGK